MVTALGVEPDAQGVGLDPVTHRGIIGARWSSPGIITGLSVHGLADKPGRYAVWTGAGVCPSVDGMTEVFLPWTMQTENAGTLGDGAYDRIDRVYLRVGTSRDDNTVHAMVAVGTPSADPKAPALPAGCLRLADMRLPAGATSMASAYQVGDVDYAIPYGASLGLLGEYVDTRAQVWGDDRVRWWSVEYPVRFYVPTDRMVELSYDADVAYVVRGDQGQVLPVGDDDWASWAVTFTQDGDKNIPNTTCETLLKHGVWTHTRNSKILTVKRGSHQVAVRQGLANKKGDGRPFMVYGDYDGLTYPGRTFRVWDRGPVR